MASMSFIRQFNEVGKQDVSLVGGKGANLGEMTKAGFPVPPGFIVTSQAYFYFLRENNLKEKIRKALHNLDVNNTQSLQSASKHATKLLLSGKIPEKLAREIFSAYRVLGGVFKNTLVAVRSSATAEDLPNASFAGQQETYLNVKGEANVLLKIREAWASLFTARAIFYREEQKFDHFKVGIAVPVQKMVQSEKSGVMFSIDPLTNDKKKIVIEAIYGLGELIVQGAVTPDHYEVAKDTLHIIEKKVSIQEKEMVKKGIANKILSIDKKRGSKQKVTDKEIKILAGLSKRLEKHYFFPQDSEWAIEDEEIYIVQTRPVTTVGKQKTENRKQNYEIGHLTSGLRLLIVGDPASPGIATGTVRILNSAKEIDKIKDGDVLVTTQTNPDFVPAMKKAVAIVTNTGGRTSHAAIVSREIGIPAVVGTQKATKILKDREIVTVNGTKGEIYKGGMIRSSSLGSSEEPVIQTATKVYVNLAEPEFAEKIAQKQVDGVGLLRAEFMMAGIGTHPKKFIQDGKKHEFIKRLADNLEMFCKPFYPRPVVYRTSDFKTNEYRNLTGGKAFEPEEPNPMLGYRGAYRYIHDSKVFDLELEAIKEVRNKRKLTNLWVMLPFVRTVDELVKVKKIIEAAGLRRSHSFKLWMMVEIPANVIILDKFIDAGLDGVSIGSNDLTMLTLGTDRDNDLVASEFSELNDAVLWSLEHVIKTCVARKITSSICGQAPSQYPELVEKLISWGVTSVSISPDAIYNVRKTIAKVEKKLIT